MVPSATENTNRYAKSNIISRMVQELNLLFSPNLRPEITWNKIILTASFRIPSPNTTAFKTGYFVDCVNTNFTFIYETTTTVSVAQRMLLNINTSFRVKAEKIYPFINMRKHDIQTNPISVPMMP
jgi:hypothetical protein